ncbi:MAG: FAD-dependent oxidoreductase [Lachnospiraceae bacterium]|nr:FAD-dependent oxidoreductase [Lachnospiraceae bacterium]
MDVFKTEVKSPAGVSYEIKAKAHAYINPDACVNCGECREACPVNAIQENQRLICRLCESCTSRPALLHTEMTALATEKSCTTACPLGISPQGYLNLIRAGKEKEAFWHIWDRNCLPSVCGRICHHPCEQACKRGILVDEPMAIRGAKRYLADKYSDEPVPAYPKIYDMRVAVIGAGPAGLAAAHKLAKSGYSVTVFDKETKAGGMLIEGIPKFRLPRDVVARDVARLEDAGIEFRFGELIGKNQIEQMKQEFDKIIIATGTPNAKELKIDGWRTEGVYTALHFMQLANENADIWRHPGQQFIKNKKAVVIGGGDVALDCARTAIRMGMEEVNVFCVESGEDVPCHPWEREAAEEEGVMFYEGWAPSKFETLHNRLDGVKFAKVTDFSRKNGKVAFQIDKEISCLAGAGIVILAIGQAPSPLWNEYNDDAQILFAGDVRSAACSVVDAMKSGIEAAIAADESLQGREWETLSKEHELHLAPLSEKIYPTNRLKTARPDMPTLPPEVRRSSFAETEGAYSRDVIAAEVERCLQCGYSVVDEGKCIGCGTCARVCPKKDVISFVKIEKGEN